MANPGGKNQYGGPYKGAALKNAAKDGLKRAAKGSPGRGGGRQDAPSTPSTGRSKSSRADVAASPSRAKTSSIRKQATPIKPKAAPKPKASTPKRPAAKPASAKAAAPNTPAEPDVTTPAGRAEIRRRMRESEARWATNARQQADAAGFTGPPPRTKTSALRKPRAGARKAK